MNKPEFEYAGFWKRFAAYFIDLVVLLPIIIVTSSRLIYYLTLEPPDKNIDILIITNFLISLLASWIYHSALESSKYQGSFGKVSLGIIVTDLNGDRISFYRATGRHFGKILSKLICYLGILMIAFTEKKQGLHDIMSKCIVINKKSV